MGTGETKTAKLGGKIGAISPSIPASSSPSNSIVENSFQDRGSYLLFNKFVKAGADPEHVKNTLEDNLARWRLQVDRQRQHDSLIKKGKKSELRYPDKIVSTDPATYKNYNDFEKAISGLPMNAVEENELEKEKAKEGYELILSDQGYNSYKIKTPEGLSELAKGSNWCTKSKQVAKSYLEDHDYTVITKDEKPLVAIKTPREPDEENEVWHRSNKELQAGVLNHSKAEGKQLMLQQDIDFVNKALKAINQPELNLENIQPIKDEDERLRLIEDAFAKNDKNKILQIITSFREKLPEKYEKKLLESSNLDNALFYTNATHQRFPALEDKLAENITKTTNFDDIAKYCKAIGGRFPEPHRKTVEEQILKYPGDSAGYAEAVSGRLNKGELKEFEERIASSPAAIVYYVSQVVGDVFPEPHRAEAEKNLLEGDAYNMVMYARASKKRFKAGEAKIAKNDKNVMTYVETFADEFRQEGFPEYEKLIDNAPQEAIAYTKALGGKRFKAAEAAIARKIVTSMEYANLLSKKDIEELKKDEIGQTILRNARKL